MKLCLILFLFAICYGPLHARIAPTLEKSTAYFYDRYSKPKTDQLIPKHNFWSPNHATFFDVKGPFVVRTYVHEKLRVTVIFAHPSLQAVHVTYALNATWTSEQASAAFAAYGKDWTANQEIGRPAYFISEDGHAAQVMLTQLFVLSSGLVEALNKAHAADQEERRRVPKF